VGENEVGELASICRTFRFIRLALFADFHRSFLEFVYIAISMLFSRSSVFFQLFFTQFSISSR